MDTSSEFDVAIIGAGPAGLAAAITLGRYSALRVILIERTMAKAYRVGELIPSRAWSLLEYLGVADDLLQRKGAQTCSLLARWSTSALINNQTEEHAPKTHYALNRHILHELLTGETTRTGVELLHGHYRSGAALEFNQGWRFAVNESGRTRSIQARFIVDASGRQATIARRLARRVTIDNLVAIVKPEVAACAFEGSAIALIEAVADGWWYRVDLPGCGRTVMFLSDRESVRGGRMTNPARWSESLERCTYVAVHLESPESYAGLVTVPAMSALTTPAAGENWIAIGEAAAAFDPISSQGIGYGLLSGIEGARCVMSALKGAPGALFGYSSAVHRHFDEYLANLRLVYSAPRQWTESPFWRERAKLGLRQPVAS